MVYPQPQNKPAPPWTPTRLLQKRKVYPKRMGFMMQVADWFLSALNSSSCLDCIIDKIFELLSMYLVALLVFLERPGFDLLVAVTLSLSDH